jgi:rhodanese-related sulfurtransferase
VLSLKAQLLRLLAVACALTGVLVAVRGTPQFRAGTGDPDSQAGACAAPDSGGFHVQYITPDEAHALLGQPNVAFVDCRPRQDFEAGHVAGSLHVEAEASALGPTVLELARAAGTVVTYCDGQSECDRSLRVATLLTQAGASDVRVIQGGMPAWLSQGFPAQSGACEECGAQP